MAASVKMAVSNLKAGRHQFRISRKKGKCKKD